MEVDVCSLCAFYGRNLSRQGVTALFGEHLRYYHPAGLDKDLRFRYPALDLNGQGAPASRPSRSRRRTSEARRTGA